MNLTELEQRVLLALLEHGTGHLNSLPGEQLRELLGCSPRELIEARATLFGLGLASGSQTSDHLTTEGIQVARALQAAPERERQEAAEARRQRRNAIVKGLLCYIIAPVAAIVLASLLLRWLGVI